MKVLVILAHHRQDSLTFQIKSEFERGLKETGHQVDTLDLFKIKFDPILYDQDEPKWFQETQHYSKQVIQEQERLLKYDAIAFVFPMYWWSMPSILKGYIERVWNYDFAHGNVKKLKFQKCLWLSLAGAKQQVFQKYGYDKMVDTYFNLGIAGFCGLENSKLKLFYDANKCTPHQAKQLLDQAYQEGLNFHTW